MEVGLEGEGETLICFCFVLQVKAIRKKMVDIITKEVTTNDMKEVVNKLIPDSVSKDIEKACHGIYPLHDVYIRKVGGILNCFWFNFPCCFLPFCI